MISNIQVPSELTDSVEFGQFGVENEILPIFFACNSGTKCVQFQKKNIFYIDEICVVLFKILCYPTTKTSKKNRFFMVSMSSK